MKIIIENVDENEYFVKVFAEDVGELDIEDAYGIGDMDWDYEYVTDAMDYHGSVFTTTYIDKDGDGISGDVKEFLLLDAESVIEQVSFEPIRVDFKIVSNRNEEVYSEGYVEINDAEAEDTDWYYWNGSGYDSHRIIWHDGVEITGATVEQQNEIAQFESDLLDNMDWTTDIILQSEEDENKTHVRENLTLIINEGDLNE